MKKLLLLLTITILLATSVTAITSCHDFSTKIIHDYSYEYGRYPPRCPTCDDPEYNTGQEWYKIKDTQSKLPQPYGYSESKENRMDSYWQYYKEFQESFKPKEGAVRYTESMGMGGMSTNNAAANLADQKLFLEEFTPADVCKPGFEIEVEEFVDDEEEEIDMEPDEYVEIEPIVEDKPPEKTCLNWQKLEDGHCVDRCPNENLSWDEKTKECVDLSLNTEECFDWQELKDGQCLDRCPKNYQTWDEETKECAGPDEDPCENFKSVFGIPNLKYDLKYTEKELKEMMTGALKSYTVSNDLYDEETIGSTYQFLNNWGSDEKKNKLEAPKENDVLFAVKKRFESTQKPLTPGELFKVCLEETGGKMDTALYTCHNVLKWKGYKARHDVKEIKENQDRINYNNQQISELESTKDAKKISNLKKQNERYNEENNAMEVAIALYSTYLEDIRPYDNVGAWYHLFGTTGASYRMGGVVSSVCVWGEHKILKGLFGTWSQHDYVEHCWDSWATEVGYELKKTAKEAGIVEQA